MTVSFQSPQISFSFPQGRPRPPRGLRISITHFRLFANSFRPAGSACGCFPVLPLFIFPEALEHQCRRIPVRVGAALHKLHFLRIPAHAEDHIFFFRGQVRLPVSVAFLDIFIDPVLNPNMELHKQLIIMRLLRLLQKSLMVIVETTDW